MSCNCRQGLISTVAFGEIVEIIHQLRLQGTANGEGAEWSVRYDITVKFTGPVDQAITTGVADQDVATGAAIGEIFIRGRGVRSIIGRVGVVVVVGIHQVITATAPEVVTPGTADQPVVTQVAEDPIITVSAHRDTVRIRKWSGLVIVIEIENELDTGSWQTVNGRYEAAVRINDNPQSRVVLIVSRELTTAIEAILQDVLHRLRINIERVERFGT